MRKGDCTSVFVFGGGTGLPVWGAYVRIRELLLMVVTNEADGREGIIGFGRPVSRGNLENPS